jgi:hypothetical protein
MSGMYPVADSKIFIGGKINVGATDLTAASFTSQVWTEVDGWANAGAIGDTSEVISQALINRGRTYKAKGTKDAGTSDQQFMVIGNDPGQRKMNAALEDNCNNYAFRIQWGANCAPSAVVTFTAASATDTVVNWTAHGRQAGDKVVFTNEGGAVPTGMTAGDVYYVIATDLTTDSFKVSATEGGTAVQATTAGTGTTTATAPVEDATSMFAALVTSNQRQGGDANAFQMRTYTLAINSNIVDV